VNYVDSSILAAWLLDQPLEKAFARVVEDGEPHTLDIAQVEIARALERAKIVGQMSDDEFAEKVKMASDLFDGIAVIRTNEAIIARARIPFGLPVRALDALHVAAAEWLAERIEGSLPKFITQDRRQAQAALARGLDVPGVSE